MPVIHRAEKKEARPALTRVYLLKAVLQGYRVRLDEELAPKGITTAQLRLLWAIAENPRSSGAQIARSCSITPQTGQQTMARMESLGWIQRHPSDGNERVLVAELTEAGHEMLMVSREIAQRLDSELWDGIPEQDLVGMTAALQAAVDRLERP